MSFFFSFFFRHFSIASRMDMEWMDGKSNADECDRNGTKQKTVENKFRSLRVCAMWIYVALSL